MKPTEKIEKSIRQLQDRTGAELDARTLTDACQVLAKKQQTQPASAKPNIWGIVMRNRTIRIATAAAVIIGVLLGIQHFTGSVDGTSTAFAQMAEAMKKMRWMHGIAELTWPEEDKYRKNGRSESWQSFELGIYISILPNGQISFFDHNKKEVRIYDPEKNQITVSYKGTENEVVAGAGSPQEVVEKMVKILSDNEGATVDRRMEKRDGKEVEIIKVSVPRGEGLEEWINIVDPKTHLPLGMKLQGHMEDGKFVEIMDGKFDYPETGPTNIYQAGAPRDAKIINELPTPEAEDLLETCRKKRANFLSYISIVSVGNSHIEVSYIDGDVSQPARQYKTATYSYLYTGKIEHVVKQAENGFDSLLEWIQSSSDVGLLRIDLWDGKKGHVVDNINGVLSYKREREPGSCRNVGGYAWPYYRPGGKIVQDDYSIDNNLICLRAYRSLFYFDPKHDYVCLRRKYTQQDEDEAGAYRFIRETTGLAQTGKGFWYPRSSDWIQVNLDADGKEISRQVNVTDHIWIKVTSQFPEGIFDRDALPK